MLGTRAPVSGCHGSGSSAVRSWMDELTRMSAVDLATDSDLPTAVHAAATQFLDAPLGGPYELYLSERPAAKHDGGGNDGKAGDKGSGWRASLRASVALGQGVQRKPPTTWQRCRHAPH